MIRHEQDVIMIEVERKQGGREMIQQPPIFAYRLVLYMTLGVGQLGYVPRVGEYHTNLEDL